MIDIMLNSLEPKKSKSNNCSYPAGYATTPVVGDTSNAALLHTVNPRTFFNLIWKQIKRHKNWFFFYQK